MSAANERSAELIAKAGDEFPATKNCLYLNGCDTTLIGRRTRAAVDRYLDNMMFKRGAKADDEKVLDRAREKFARLVQAQPDEIALTRNVSEGINAIAQAMPWTPGDNVVLCTEIEHPNNIYPWLHLRRRGVEVRSVPARAGAIDVEAMVDAIDSRTRVLSCSTVSFCPGFRADLDALGAACRERSVFFLVDAVQSTGILQHDMARSRIDGLATSATKGLLGIYGIGFLYCRREWADRLQPVYLSRPAVDVPPEALSEMGTADYRLRAGARRFELGTHNYGAAFAVEASLDYLMEIGAPAIEAHVTGLSARLAQGLLDLGLPVAGGAPGAHLAHIVTFGKLGAGGHDFSTDESLNRLYRFLKANAVYLTIRRGMLRFALHVYNSKADVERVLDLVAEGMKTNTEKGRQTWPVS